MLMGQDPITLLRLQKKLKIADFRPKVTSRNLSEKGVNFSLGFWRWISSFLLGQDFGDGIPPFYWVSGFWDKNSLSRLALSMDRTD